MSLRWWKCSLTCRRGWCSPEGYGRSTSRWASRSPWAPGVRNRRRGRCQRNTAVWQPGSSMVSHPNSAYSSHNNLLVSSMKVRAHNELMWYDRQHRVSTLFPNTNNARQTLLSYSVHLVNMDTSCKLKKNPKTTWLIWWHILVNEWLTSTKTFGIGSSRSPQLAATSTRAAKSSKIACFCRCRTEIVILSVWQHYEKNPYSDGCFCLETKTVILSLQSNSEEAR